MLVAGKGIIRIRMYDGTMRELKEVRDIPSMINLSWSFESRRPQRDS